MGGGTEKERMGDGGETKQKNKKKKTGKGIPTDSRRCVGKGGERKTGRRQSSWAVFDVRRQSLRAAFDL